MKLIEFREIGEVWSLPNGSRWMYVRGDWSHLTWTTHQTPLVSPVKYFNEQRPIWLNNKKATINEFLISLNHIYSGEKIPIKYMDLCSGCNLNIWYTSIGCCDICKKFATDISTEYINRLILVVFSLKLPRDLTRYILMLFNDIR